MSLREKRSINPVRDNLIATGLYHSFLLPDGTKLAGAIDYDFLIERWQSFQLPQDLSGKTALDIGPWDGFFTFSLERAGAEVTAIDYVDLDTFRMLHRAFQSKARYLRNDVYELHPATHGVFDYVLLLGVLYHLKYPIEGLERVCAVTRHTCIIDTFVSDAPEGEILTAEFYESTELAGQFDNWWGPTPATVIAWARTAGFAEVELLAPRGQTACFAARRVWTKLAAPSAPPLQIVAIHHHQNRGRTFQTSKEEYILLWIEGEDFAVDDVFPEVDGYAVPPISTTTYQGNTQISIRRPYGLAPGRHEVRVRSREADWSSPQHFWLDLPQAGQPPVILSIQDGTNWQAGQVTWQNEAWITIWTQGLSPEADCANTTIHIDGILHVPFYLNVENGQINLQLRPLIAAGHSTVHVEHRGQLSAPAQLNVVGDPPPIRGLESLFTPAASS